MDDYRDYRLLMASKNKYWPELPELCMADVPNLKGTVGVFVHTASYSTLKCVQAEGRNYTGSKKLESIDCPTITGLSMLGV